MMIALINYLIESSLILIFGYLFYLLILANKSSYQTRRMTLLFIAMISGVIPLIELNAINMTSWGIGQSAELMILLPTLTINPVIQPEDASFYFHWMNIILWCYLLGVAVMSLRLLSKFFLLALIFKSGKSKNGKDGIKIIYTEKNIGIFSFFNWLIINANAQINDHEMQHIISHEKAHIRQGHSYDIILMELLMVLLWFNPCVWLLKKSIVENHEFIADLIAIRSCNKSEYGRILGKIALSSVDHKLNMGSYFSKVLTLRRIQKIKEKAPPIIYSNLLAFTAMFTVLIVVFGCNNDLIDEVKDASEMTNIPNSVKAKLSEFQNQYPGIDFFYQEVPFDFETGKSPVTWNKNLVRFNHPLKNQNVLGLIMVREEHFLKLAEMSKTDNGDYTLVEQQPVPQQGLGTFYEYISSQLVYPAEARVKGIEGRVFIEFVVDRDGQLTNVKCIKGIGHGCDQSAVDIIQSSTAWTPGRINGEKVKVKMILPITFKLSET